MSASAEKVKNIINEIENGYENENDNTHTAKTVDEIINVFQNSSSSPKSSIVKQSTGFFDMEELTHWKEQMNQTYQIPYNREIICFRRHFRKPIIFVKRLIRKMCRSLIQPIVEEQNSFNANTTAAINALFNNEIVTEKYIMDLQSFCESIIQKDNEEKKYLSFEQKFTDLSESYLNLKADVEGLSKKYFDLQAENEKILSKYLELKEEFEKYRKQTAEDIKNRELKLEKEYEKIKSEEERQHTHDEMLLFRNARLQFLHQTTENISKKDTELQNSEDTTIYSGIDYFDFENHFRGSRKEIKEAESAYIPYYKDKRVVIDLGCGRGEFLELLKENGISGVGVDIYTEFVDYCIAKGLKAQCDDAIKYLMGMENNSVGGIFAAQLIEHLTTEQLIKLCHLAYAKLETGGCLILETPNPMCLSVYMHAFYIDPSHQKPVHPETMKYLLQRAGFGKVEILFTERSKSGYRLPLLSCEESTNLSEFNDGINLLSDILFGSEDYAVIAVKE